MTPYDDGRTRLDDDEILLRRYYFPFGRAKRIGWDEVRAARSTPLKLINGRWRIWGSGTPTVWLGLDGGRPKRTTLVTIDLGKRIKPAFTPVDPVAALDVVERRTRLDRTPAD